MAKSKMPKMPKIKPVKAPKIPGMKKPKVGIGKGKVGGGGGKVKLPAATGITLTPMVDILEAARKRFKV